MIERKFGLRGKHIAALDEHVSDLAVKAAEPLIAEHGADVGAVVYFGSAHKDYYLWSCAPKVQHALGLVGAFAFELMATSACAPIALREINRQGVAVLLVEQNVPQSLRLAARAYVLENGRIILQGSGQELLESPHVREAYLRL